MIFSRYDIYGDNYLVVWTDFYLLNFSIFHFRLTPVTEGKMGVTRFFILSTFLVLMFGFALSLPTVGNEDPEQGKYKPYYLSFPVAYENSLMIKLYVQRSYSPIKTLYLSFPHFNFYPELKIQTFPHINYEAFKYRHNIVSPRSLQRHGVWSIFFFSVSGVGLSRMIRALGPASNGTPEGRYIALRRKAK